MVQKPFRYTDTKTRGVPLNPQNVTDNIISPPKKRGQQEENNDFKSIISNTRTSPTEVRYKGGRGNINDNQKKFADAQNLLNFEFALDEGAREFETAYQTRAIQVSQARDNYINMMKQRDIQMNAAFEAFSASQEMVANQLAFNQQGAERALADADTVRDDRLAQAQFQSRELDFREQEQDMNTAAQLAELDVNDFQAEQQFRLTQAEAQRQRNISDLATSLTFERQNSEALYELRSRQADTAFQQQQVQIQSILSKGQARSLGRTGVSSDRTGQTILAMAGINTSKLNRDLLRFETQESAQAKFRERTRDIGLQEAAEREQSAIDSATAQKNISDATTNIARTRAQEMQVIANNRMEMNREELGETLLSVLNGYEQSREQIFLDKFQADAQAYGQLMTEPQFVDPPKEPFKIPKIDYIPPPLPLEVPKGPNVQAPPSNKTSIFGKILQIGGMVASLASIPLTAGASAPLTAAQGTMLATAGTSMQTLGGAGWF